MFIQEIPNQNLKMIPSHNLKMRKKYGKTNSNTGNFIQRQPPHAFHTN